MTRRVVAAVLLVFGLAACGAGPTSDGPPNRDPHRGWVKIQGYDQWRCLGGDKIVYTYSHGDESGSTVAIKDSKDCQ